MYMYVSMCARAASVKTCARKINSIHSYTVNAVQTVCVCVCTNMRKLMRIYERQNNK